MKNIITYTILMAALITGLATCDGQTDVYEKYVVPNGLIYPGPALNPTANSGYKRIQILWNKGSDPRVRKARIFWNNYTDSVELPVAADTDTVRCIIDPIAENTYSFMIHTYDDEENISIPVEVMGTVYGDGYQNRLMNRLLKSSLYDGEDVILNWGAADDTEIGILVSWTDKNGTTRTLEVNPSETETLIPYFDLNQPLHYTTTYKPDSTAIDIFRSPTAERMIDPIIEIPKNTWASYLLPGDMGINNSYPMHLFWDGNTTNFMHSDGTTSVPISFTWDMGRKAILDRLKFWPRPNNDDRWNKGMPRFFEIWGALEVNPEDGSFDAWTRLGTFECVQPSGNGIADPWQAPTSEDITLATTGLDFKFVPGPTVNPAVTVRYIRFVSLENFNQSQTPRLLLAEISFWGTLVK
jgi:hypothetical protein